MDIFSVEVLVALFTLVLMEIVLGIDNIIFISILVSRVQDSKREKIRSLGLILALVMRLALLFSISWVMSLTDPWFILFDKAFSGRDIILLSGGLFLLGKSTSEIHHKVQGESEKDLLEKGKAAAGMILFQIVILDIVFSLDSVITAVGMAKEIWVMVVAMVVSMIVMLISAKSIGNFVDRNPTIKILALSFLLLIGVMLVAEGMGQHLSKGYIYFAIGFSLMVEMLNMKYRKSLKKKAV